jgi:adenylate cyclase
MAYEIERKFLLINEQWRDEVENSFTLQQGYLSTNPNATVRIRIKNEQATLTIKSKNIGIRRNEFEYQIPTEEAQQLLALCEGPLIEKIRYTICRGSHTWEIDEFNGHNTGLILAEIELTHEDDAFEKPTWVGDEVSDDVRYYNSNLVAHPFINW